MQIIKITNIKQLNEFVSSQKHAQFLQSWEWGEFQEKVSGKIWRIGVEKDNKLVVVATLIKKTLPMGKSYFYCPRGPIVSYKLSITNYELIFNFFINEIEKLSVAEGVIFLRFEPCLSPSLALPRSSVTGEGTIFKTIDVQPSKTLILDLSKSEEEILKNMHQKTRYNIRLADKKGLKVIEVGQDKFNEFWQIMKETNKRDNFRLHNKEYYKKMISVNNIKLLMAEYKNKIVAGIIVSFFGDMGVYVHGASSNKYRNVMAPYLLQWTAIKMAKGKGCKYYDLNGINENKWPGVTRFKKGFSGKEVNYPGTFDKDFNNFRYFIYKIIRKTRRIF